MNKLQKKINWEPHDAQQEILASTSKDVVICAGRRFGKSVLCAYVILETLVQNILDLRDGKNVKPAKIWIVAPNYDLTDKVFEYLTRYFLKVFPDWAKMVTTRTPAMIKTPFGAEIRCKSADNPTSLLGEELDLLVIDECSRIKKSVYETHLYPTTTSRPNCRRFFISTPHGKNWFYDEWLRAKKKGGAFHFTSLDGVSVSKEIWEESKERLPADVFSQEFEAAFLDSASAVFRNIKDCVLEELRDGKPPIKGHRYIMGVDLAKFNDFTVLTVVDKKTHEVVAIDRFNKIDYPLQKRRIFDLANKYDAKIVMDAMNVGASIGDDLRAQGMRVEDFKATGDRKTPDWEKKGTKTLMIDKLSSFIQTKNIKIPPNQILIDELEAFGYSMTEGGNITYQAPTGLHDDCFVKGTLILTNNGQTPIQNIKVGDLVMTRDGYKPVIMTMNKRKKVISNLNLRGTPDHPVITTNGDIPLINISNNDILHIWNTSKQKIEKLSFIKARNIIDTQTLKEDNCEFISGDIQNGKNLRNHYIDKFGLIIMGRYQKVISFIMKMKIRLIMILRTFKLNLEANMLPNISGIDQYKEQDVYNVEKYSLFNSIKVPSFAKQFVGKDLKEIVYNLQVGGKPEYFANNILVHNCVNSLGLAVWLLEGKAKVDLLEAKRSIPKTIKKRFQYK